MRKVKFILLIISLTTLFFTGCNNNASTKLLEDYNITESGTWKDGSYSEAATGKKGKFDVTVTIEDGKISDINIGSNNETPDKGGVAIKTIPDEIIDTQSPNVDAVSGATITSDAIKDAVARCLERASAVE